MYKLYCRMYQTIFKGVSYVLPFRKPTLLKDVESLPNVAKSLGLTQFIIITDATIVSLGLLNSLIASLDKAQIKWTLYDKTVPNPTIQNIEEALQLYHEKQCQGLIAFGGGSSIDCAKGVAARLARPNKTIPQLKGVLKVHKRIPTLFAIPTTSGTGSEATIAAVITNSDTHEKYAINDTSLIPNYAVLDPKLTIGLPPHITSTTGIDALTHAVEAYIGNSNTKETKAMSRDAVKLIIDNIYEAYSNGTNIDARAHMQMASYYAGIAFTRAYIGYVHAIAHTLGGFYNVPHGLANAVVLPYVLKAYGTSVYKKLAELESILVPSDNTSTEEMKAKQFIERIIQLNASMNIPTKIKGIVESDIPLMVERAYKEANPLYPVPKILNREELTELYYKIKE